MARNLVTTQTTPHPDAIPTQVQYLEPLPPWLEREISQGIEHLPALRAALCRAQLKSKGVLHQHLRNDDQGYTYTSFAEVLGATREAMASEGLSLDQVTSDIEEEVQAINSYGKSRSLWRWRTVCLITHQDGASIVRIVRTITAVGEKAAGAARTATDRTLTMTVMRVAGAKEDQTTREDQDTRSYRQGPREAPNRERRPPQNDRNTQNGQNTQNGRNAQNGAGLTPPPPTEAELKAAKGYVDELIATLTKTEQAQRLTTWARLVLGKKLPFYEHERASGAIKQRAAELKLDARAILTEAKKLGPLTQEQVTITSAGDWTDPQGLFL